MTKRHDGIRELDIETLKEMGLFGYDCGGVYCGACSFKDNPNSRKWIEATPEHIADHLGGLL